MATVGIVMPDGYQVADASVESPRRVSFLEEFCLPFLADAQSPDGGWGYHPGSRSSVESTCWALLALASVSKSSELAELAGRGGDWLRQAQLPDGSWPAQVGGGEGCWATALACLALHAQGKAAQGVVKGLVWLCDARSGEGGLWWRLRYRFSGGSTVVRQNHSLRGWGWTPGTNSWVEPTSYSLILLRNIPEDSYPPRAAQRRRLGEEMLYDRMCPGGGWNSGNPLVYGVAGEPRVGPTVWALLALQDYCDRPQNRRSLEWLESVYKDIRGPASLALAHTCLETYGRPTPALEPALQSLYLTNQFFHHVPVVAWAAVALSPRRDWLRWTSGRIT